jgi:hypothetical protein
LYHLNHQRELSLSKSSILHKKTTQAIGNPLLFENPSLLLKSHKEEKTLNSFLAYTTKQATTTKKVCFSNKSVFLLTLVDQLSSTLTPVDQTNSKIIK